MKNKPLTPLILVCVIDIHPFVLACFCVAAYAVLLILQ